VTAIAGSQLVSGVRGGWTSKRSRGAWWPVIQPLDEGCRRQVRDHGRGLENPQRRRDGCRRAVTRCDDEDGIERDDDALLVFDFEESRARCRCVMMMFLGVTVGDRRVMTGLVHRIVHMHPRRQRPRGDSTRQQERQGSVRHQREIVV
jgi:hypothetical protein